MIALSNGPLNGDVQAVLDLFAPLGVTGEGMAQHHMVALDVPADADVSTIKALLVRGESGGRWAYEEGCVDRTWIDA